MHVRYILSSVWVRLSIFSQLPVLQYMGLCVFSLPSSPVMIERIYTLSHYHHQIGSMNYYPLFRVSSWNNCMRCMSIYCRDVCKDKRKGGFNITIYSPTWYFQTHCRVKEDFNDTTTTTINVYNDNGILYHVGYFDIVDLFYHSYYKLIFNTSWTRMSSVVLWNLSGSTGFMFAIYLRCQKRTAHDIMSGDFLSILQSNCINP